ncbi:ABC transporter permease [Streptomyces sp. NBS 14/10]|uniref:ABC transporter permease n=1 Tax=Streptomyces sp. NBS 14/10 TaxID=1945643 RepID=UPI000B7F4F76|nr:ABC transporter permease [Streptomyces sp. NBS 14/10]KAK1182991.1 ABC transporter permease [Streptomyces sp. NBS 14/10]
MTATLPATTAPGRPVAGRGLLRLALRSRRLALGLGILAVFALTALIGPWLVDDPDAVSVDLSQGPSGAHWLGTTQTGQDVFAQLVVSARGTLLIGAAVAALATAVSVVVGIGGGFLGGVADETISLISNVFLVIPGLPLVIVVSAYVKGGGLSSTIFAIALTSWAASARVLRAQTLSLRTRDYVLAARVYGEKRWRIVLVEIVPNELAIIVSQFIHAAIFAVLTQTGLAFLGLADLSHLTWGTMLYFAQGAEALAGGAWWWFVPPGLCTALLGTALSLVSFGLDEVLDPRLRTRRPRKRQRQRKEER